MRFLKFPALLVVTIFALASLSPAQNPQSDGPQSVNPQPLSQTMQRITPAQRQSNFDRGIYLSAAGNVCGSIVSYNFSAGENPRLQSITTCTPATRVASKRASGREPRPQSRRVFLMGIAEQER